MMRFADCVPIMLHDPVRKVAGIAHAGWMGTVRGTVRFAVEAMQKHYGSSPADIQRSDWPIHRSRPLRSWSGCSHSSAASLWELCFEFALCERRIT